MTLIAQPGAAFVLTPSLQSLTERAFAYLQAGYSLHLRGPAGGGKTTLALHLAALRARPLVLLHGDDALSSEDLVGGHAGYRHTRVVDNFVRSVVKTKETLENQWSENRLSVACREGATLVYDELTRSRAEAHNALLAVLEERIVPMSRRPGAEDVASVHPEFRMVCTSNSQEYVGVHRAPDALLDRLVTLYVGHPDRETEVAITRAKSGLGADEAVRIVELVRHVRERRLSPQSPSLRACLMIARVAVQTGAVPRAGDDRFREICVDVLGGLAAGATEAAPAELLAALDEQLSRWPKGGAS
jgi:nitric oxide reductase NorQ protein